VSKILLKKFSISNRN